MKRQMHRGFGDGLTWTLARTDHPNADTEQAASALLHCVARSTDPDAVGRNFSNAAIELALASYPGFTVTAPPAKASPYGVFTAAYLPQEDVPHDVVLADGERIPIPPPERTAALTGADEPTETDLVGAPPPPTPARSAPLGSVAGARSGDKGGSANLGVWARTPAGFVWLHDTLTVERLAELLPETAELA
ncbi:MAG: hypothetical protein M5U19_06940 [Microthrixaceae bacterium]|nr:hypothetical protein [Microthrixaceae bacterium]